MTIVFVNIQNKNVLLTNFHLEILYYNFYLHSYRKIFFWNTKCLRLYQLINRTLFYNIFFCKFSRRCWRMRNKQKQLYQQFYLPEHFRWFSLCLQWWVHWKWNILPTYVFLKYIYNIDFTCIKNKRAIPELFSILLYFNYFIKSKYEKIRNFTSFDSSYKLNCWNKIYSWKKAIWIANITYLNFV